MKEGDIVRFIWETADLYNTVGIVVEEPRYGIGTVDILVEGEVISVGMKTIEVINEGR